MDLIEVSYDIFFELISKFLLESSIDYRLNKGISVFFKVQNADSVSICFYISLVRFWLV